MNFPLVSISCTTYNHAKYIRNALESFLMQKTDFPFEILIHDDASTDGTTDIIREYAAKYPDIIKPLCETENQFSKGKSIWCEFQFPVAKGKYIALCEGDDFWIDPHKLQIQYDFMESHPDFSLCGCGYWNLNYHNKRISPAPYTKSYPESYPQSTKGILLAQHPFHTAGLFFRKSSYEKIEQNFKRDTQNTTMSDLQLMFHLSLAGKIKYFPDRMTMYRIAPNSATHSKNPENNQKTIDKMRNDTIKMAENNGCLQWIDEFVAEHTPRKEKFKYLHKAIRFCQYVFFGYYLLYALYICLPPYWRVRFLKHIVHYRNTATI